MSARNNASEQSSNLGSSSLRPPSTGNRPGHHLRASADMSGAFSNPMGGGRIRPASEIFLNPPNLAAQATNSESEAFDKNAREWLSDLETIENTLEDMASAALDQEFKDELSAIEQWFRVLSEAERTAALYALLQQATQVQIRFFIQVLGQMSKSHPMANLLSPSTFEKDPMASRMNEAMNKVNLGNTQNSFGRPPASPGASNAASMFPDAAAAIAAQKAKIAGSGGAASGIKSNRNSGIYESRSTSSNLAPTPSINTTGASGQKENNPPQSPWGRPSADRTSSNEDQPTSRPKSAAGGGTMGNFTLPQPPSGGGLRSPRNPPPQISGNQNIQTTTLQAPTGNENEMPQLSPYAASSGNWASMVSTPVNTMFPPSQQTPNSDMLANATAMKLAALSTVNSRIILDNDPKGWGKRRNKDGTPSNGMRSPGLPGQMPTTPATIQMVNELGQVVHMPASAAGGLGQQNGSPMMNGRSRPTSPGLFAPQQWGNMNFASPQSGGFLTAHAQSPLLSSGMLSQFGGLDSAGYASDEVSGRGRSPRGRRGSSKPPEDPTNPDLLGDIPSWLRSLRLHKYTDNLKDLKWTELVELDDDALEKRGVNALGARRKMLKVFDQVKAAQNEGKL